MDAEDSALIVLLQHMLEHITKTDDRLGALEVRIIQGLHALQKQGEQLMTRGQEILDLVGQLDSTTNGMAERISAVAAILEDLRSQLQGGASPSEVDQIVARLGSSVTVLTQESDDLRQLGADPNNPVPAKKR